MMTQEQTEEIETPYTTRMWGQECRCEPKAVQSPLGGGGELVWLQPLSTRPHYYVLSVPKEWIEDDMDGIPDHLEEMYEAIEEYYGNSEDEDNEDTDHGWPALNLDCGVSWGMYEVAESDGFGESVPTTYEEREPALKVCCREAIGAEREACCKLVCPLCACNPILWAPATRQGCGEWVHTHRYLGTTVPCGARDIHERNEVR